MIRQALIHSLLVAVAVCAAAATAETPATMEQALTGAANGSHRSAANIARNQYRHPVETLMFFGVADGMTVLEISPGGLWYTEVLAPALRLHIRGVLSWRSRVPPPVSPAPIAGSPRQPTALLILPAACAAVPHTQPSPASAEP